MVISLPLSFGSVTVEQPNKVQILPVLSDDVATVDYRQEKRLVLC